LARGIRLDIVKQLRYLGSSAMGAGALHHGEGCSKAVTKVFVSLYNKGLIYRATHHQLVPGL
jgi:valyl-tRNA synthetase